MSLERKRHNPKTHAPAVYIPCWLSQVPTRLLSNNAKVLYGRLSQWSNSTGDVYRSLPQLVEELGTPRETLKRHLKELKNAGLIGTYHPQAGGINHYAFYHHIWMDKPIHQNLSYESDPGSNVNLGRVKCEPTPGSDVTHINKKEIKRNKKELNTLVDSPNTTPSRKPSSYKKDERFMRFYSEYPRKEKPADAWKAFKAIKPDDSLLCDIVEDVKQRSLLHTQWRDKKYIPLPASYLRSATYEGEIYNEESDNKEQKALAAAEAALKMKAQEEASQKRADKEHADQEMKFSDARAGRAIGVNPKCGAPPGAWEAMKVKLNIRGS